MTSTERGRTTPYLTDFGWVFLRHADFPELEKVGMGKAATSLSKEAKSRAFKIVHDRWCAGRGIHGWTVKCPLRWPEEAPEPLKVAADD